MDRYMEGNMLGSSFNIRKRVRKNGICQGFGGSLFWLAYGFMWGVLWGEIEQRDRD